MQTYSSLSLREAFGAALVEMGRRRDDLRVFDAGTMNSTMSEGFQKAFPDRFYTVGINEPGMIGLAAGVAMAGRRVVACDMSIFLQHAYAHLLTAARQGNDLHFIVAASHTGVAVGPDGGSAHDITDVARMRLIPGFKVITPWDARQVKRVLEVVMEKPGFYYIRLNRPKVPIFLDDPAPFEIGRAYVLREGTQVTIAAMGDKVFTALEAADELGPGVAEVIGVSTVEPFDIETIAASAAKTRHVVTFEDHIPHGGLYETIAGALAENHPTLMRKAAAPRVYTTSGEPDELARLYGLDKETLVAVCRSFIDG